MAGETEIEAGIGIGEAQVFPKDDFGKELGRQLRDQRALDIRAERNKQLAKPKGKKKEDESPEYIPTHFAPFRKPQIRDNREYGEYHLENHESFDGSPELRFENEQKQAMILGSAADSKKLNLEVWKKRNEISKSGGWDSYEEGSKEIWESLNDDDYWDKFEGNALDRQLEAESMLEQIQQKPTEDHWMEGATKIKSATKRVTFERDGSKVMDLGPDSNKNKTKARNYWDTLSEGQKSLAILDSGDEGLAIKRIEEAINANAPEAVSDLPIRSGGFNINFGGKSASTGQFNYVFGEGEEKMSLAEASEAVGLTPETEKEEETIDRLSDLLKGTEPFIKFSRTDAQENTLQSFTDTDGTAFRGRPVGYTRRGNEWKISVIVDRGPSRGTKRYEVKHISRTKGSPSNDSVVQAEYRYGQNAAPFVLENFLQDLNISETGKADGQKSVPTVTTQEQYDALPAGAEYIDSTGAKGRKK